MFVSTTTLVMALTTLLPSSLAQSEAPKTEGACPSTKELLRLVHEAYGASDKKYASLAQDLRQAVDKAMSTARIPYDTADPKRPMASFPSLKFCKKLDDRSEEHTSELQSL